MGETEQSLWQTIRYGDSPAARAALAYWRVRGWDIDNPNFTPQTDEIEARIYAFIGGYEAAQEDARGAE